MRILSIMLCIFATLPALARDYQRAELHSYAGGDGSTDEPAIAGGGGMALAPLPVNFLSGMAVVEAGGRMEATERLSHSRVGMTYFQHVAEGVPNFRLSTHRIGNASGTSQKPVVESTAMVQGNDADHGWLRTLPGFRTRVGLGVRTTHRPERQLAAEPMIEIAWERRRRLLIEILAPRSAEVRYTGGAQRSWAAFLKAESSPLFLTGDEATWQRIPERRVFVGSRVRVGGDWFVGLNAGQWERDAFAGPFAELSLQNWKFMP